MNKNLVGFILIALVAAILWVALKDRSSAPLAVSISIIGDIDNERIYNADTEPSNWLAFGRTYEEQRFSPLSQINRDNVSDLGLAWYKDMQSNRALEATPIVVDGMMFLSSEWSKVYALDAKTGEEIWFYDPEVPGAWGRKACCDVVNRGVAIYKGKVYFGSLDGRLIALDAATGELIWEVDTLLDRNDEYTITGAPRVANDKVFIGNGGAEFGVRGYITAYDVHTGEQVWRFYTVPGDPSLPFEHPELEMAAKTWNGEWWEIGGGGTVWNSIVYDPDFNHLYFGVGNGSPWTRAIRSPGGGDNLFLSSIVAVDADTGQMKWYYQTTPGDNWDYTAIADMVLADMEVDGKQRKVLMQAPKNGFFYVIDRSNGELLRANKFVTATWATHVDMETGRPVEDPAFDYIEDPKWVLPGPDGAHSWQAMAFDAGRRLAYIPAVESPFVFSMKEEWKKTGKYKHIVGGWNLGVESLESSLLNMSNAGEPLKAQGYLKAFDPLTGKSKWIVELLHYWNGGTLATAGDLVFQGNSVGDVNAFDADTGEVLWTFNAFTAFLAPPVTYMIDGTQYIAILAGTGGGGALFAGEVPNLASVTYGNFGKLLVFKLGGDVELPPPTVLDRTIPEPPESDASEEEIQTGKVGYHSYCAGCHGSQVRSSGVIKDLRLMLPEIHSIFKEIVFDGVYAEKGMAGYADLLNETEIDQIHAYIISRANEDREAALAEGE